jgi:hypothetical protein
MSLNRLQVVLPDVGVEFVALVVEVASGINNNTFSGFIEKDDRVFLNRVKCKFLYLDH